MPLVDMPLEKLYSYKGINPRPDDFDQYWDESLEEMRALPQKIELIPAKFQSPVAQCFDLYFTGIGGAKIHAKLLKPRNVTGKCPAVVQFHGYTGNCGDWQEKVAYAGSGFVMASLDCRGQGGLSEDIIPTKGNTREGCIIRGLDDPDPKKLYYRAVFMDCVQLVNIVMNMPEVDETRVGTMGVSQGGGLSIACASLEPRINRASTHYPFLSDYKRVWQMDLAINAYKELQYYFRMFDPMHQREDEVFNRLGYIDVHHLAQRMRPRVLMFSGLMDTTCPPSTHFAAYNNMNCEKEVKIFPDFGHEVLPGAYDMVYQFMAEML